MRALFLRWMMVALLGGLLSGCSSALETVEPWERGTLAGDLMNPEFTATEERNWNHIYFSKEGGNGAFGGGGGGCGCN